MTIDRAVGTLIDQHPYYSTPVSKTKFYESETTETVAIGWNNDHLIIVSNPAFLSTISLDFQRGILKHEYAHYQLRHLTSSRNLKLETVAASIYPDKLDRLHEIVNIVCDMEINGTIVPRNGLPPGGIFAEDYDLPYGLLAEEYLRRMKEPAESQGCPCSQGADGKTKMDEALGSSNTDLLVSKLMDELDEKEMERGIKEGAMRGDTPAGLERLLAKLRPPQLSWKSIFRSAALSHLKSRLHMPTFSRLNRRSKILPGLMYRNLPDVYVFQDTSGSISTSNLVHLSSEIYGLRKYAKSIWVLVVDAALHDVYKFRGKIESVTGGGGSDFNPAFDYVNERPRKRKPIIILLTDGDITVPETINADVIWVLCQGDRDIPYGKKIILPK